MNANENSAYTESIESYIFFSIKKLKFISYIDFKDENVLRHSLIYDAKVLMYFLFKF